MGQSDIMYPQADALRSHHLHSIPAPKAKSETETNNKETPTK